MLIKTFDDKVWKNKRVILEHLIKNTTFKTIPSYRNIRIKRHDEFITIEGLGMPCEFHEDDFCVYVRSASSRGCSSDISINDLMKLQKAVLDWYNLYVAN